MSALETGVRLLPLSVTLLAAAVGIPRLLPDASPRLVVRVGILLLLAGTVVLLGAMDADSGAEIVFVPMLLIGLGMGCLASQLGAITVSAVPDEQSSEVGGIQNTMTNLGASFGTALAGSFLIAAMTTAFLTNINANPDVPQEVKDQAEIRLGGGVPFLSDADLEEAMAGRRRARRRYGMTSLDANANSRIEGLQAALAVLAGLAVVSLFFTGLIPATRKSEGDFPGPYESREDLRPNAQPAS